MCSNGFKTKFANFGLSLMTTPKNDLSDLWLWPCQRLGNNFFTPHEIWSGYKFSTSVRGTSRLLQFSSNWWCRSVVSMENMVKQRMKTYLATRAVASISIPKFALSFESVSDRLYSLPVYP